MGFVLCSHYQVFMKSAIKRFSILVIFASILCCSQQQIVQVDKQDASKCLPFLQLGFTKRQEIFYRLGDAENSYEGGRIITYIVSDRVKELPNIIKCDEKISEGTEGSLYTLVLVFGPKNQLENYSLVRIR
jgi:hypothetical protein